MTRLLRYLLIVGAAVISVLLFLLASTFENSPRFERYYPWLLIMSAVAAALLLGLVCLLLSRLWRRYRAGKFGARLMARLVLLFTLIGVLPGILIYMVSVQFVSRSIESWFDVRVESALEAGLELGRSTLDSSLRDMQSKVHNMALELADMSDATQITHLSRMLDPHLQQEALIVTGSAQLVASAGSRLNALLPEFPSADMIRQARTTGGYGVIENIAGLPDVPGGLRFRVLVPIPKPTQSLWLQFEPRYLQLIQPVPQKLAQNAEALRVTHGEYQQLYLARSGLRKLYIITLTLTLLLTMFGAIAAAFVIASDFVKPLLLLAQGTRAVAEGDLSPPPIVTTPDELGTLTQSFHAMTHQLSDARAAVEKNRMALEEAKAYLESVLANMSAGVMVLDNQFKVVTCNASAQRILKCDLIRHAGQPLSEVEGLVPFAQAIMRAFSAQNAQLSAGSNADAIAHWQHQIEVQGANEKSDTPVSLLARGSRLPSSHEDSYIIVFDDISDVISAQRSIAWGEVARRLAHEIKNPLTPIQLAAERLHMKLEDRLEEKDATMLARSTQTIVNQVTAMKRMVDDFRDYAKTPPVTLMPLNLNALIEEILHLYLASDDHDIIHTALAGDLPLIMGDATQLRQVIHNLLQNAQDAATEKYAQEQAAHNVADVPRIDVITEKIHYRNANGITSYAVQLVIMDNGPGFSAKILGHAFEPYITSKSRGTGLGLPVVKKIIEEHGGHIDIRNRSDGGAKVAILLLQLPSESDAA